MKRALSICALVALWSPLARAQVAIVLQPALTAAVVGQRFDVKVQVQAGEQPISAAGASINFDPAIIEVLLTMPGATLTGVTQDAHDNTLGSVDFAAAMFAGTVSKTFTLVTIQCQAVAVGTTTLTFSTTSERLTGAFLGNVNVTGSITGGSVEVSPVPPTSTPTATPTPLPAMIEGTCSQPGPPGTTSQQGLVACAHTTIDVSRCTDDGCTTLDTVVGNATTDVQGNFTVMLDSALVAGRRLIVEAEVQAGSGGGARTGGGAAVTLRSVTFGPIAGGVGRVKLSPSSEAAATLLLMNNLQNFSDARIDGVNKVVDNATATTDFAGKSVADAVQNAQQTASKDEGVKARLALAGDCGQDGVVTVNEILTAVNIALGNEPVSMCLAADSNADERVTVDEILEAVSKLLTAA